MKSTMDQSYKVSKNLKGLLNIDDAKRLCPASALVREYRLEENKNYKNLLLYCIFNTR
jgi:hypothetical protein